MITVPYATAVKSVLHDLEDTRCRFVARLNTPWTVLGLQAWLLRTRILERDDYGHVLIVPSAVGRQAAPALLSGGLERLRVSYIEPVDAAGLRTRRVSRVLRSPRLLLSLGRQGANPIHIVSPREADTALLLDLAGNTDRRLALDVLDEGFGRLPIQLRTNVHPVANNARIRSRGSWLGAKAIIVGAHLRVSAAELLARRFEYSEHFVVRLDAEGKCVVNSDIRDAYVRALLDTPQTWSPSMGRSALVLTTPLSEYKGASETTERTIVAGIVDALVAKGFHVLVKPHPRESDRKYGSLTTKHPANVRVLGSDLAETYIAKLRRDDLVVGYTSNALVSAGALFGLKTYSLTEVLAGFADADESLVGLYRLYDHALRGLVEPVHTLLRPS